MTDDRQQILLRREVMLGAGAMLIAVPVLAGGGGGNNGGIDTAARKPPKVESRYSQRDFTRLSAAELAEIELNQRTGGTPLEINGFTRSMSDFLLYMALHNRRRTFRLIRDMADLKGRRKRGERLAQEEKWVRAETERLTEARDRARQKNLKAAVEETETRLRYLDRYDTGLLRWNKNPDEGTY